MKSIGADAEQAFVFIFSAGTRGEPNGVNFQMAFELKRMKTRYSGSWPNDEEQRPWMEVHIRRNRRVA